VYVLAPKQVAWIPIGCGAEFCFTVVSYASESRRRKKKKEKKKKKKKKKKKAKGTV
jgi:hypothetical protein